jgi:XTP/dITP diphosphohydrolase
MSRGVFEGRIGVPPRVPSAREGGGAGFGYDPLFLVAPDYLLTSAELTAEDKHRLSHRGAAARGMRL